MKGISRNIFALNKEAIYQTIKEHEPDGIWTEKLAEVTGLHRDTIYVRCKELIAEGRIRKTNKHGFYHIIQDSS
jgi:hypothetical protein